MAVGVSCLNSHSSSLNQTPTLFSANFDSFMTVELKPEAGQMAERADSHKEETFNVVDEPVKDDQQAEESEEKMKAEEEEEEEEEEPHVIEKRSSFKEDGNFLSDLRETERKALTELKAKLEKAILNNNLFNNNQEGEQNDEVSLWGVPLLTSKSSDATNIVLLKFLRAREFRVKESFEMIQNTLQWRMREKIDSVVDETELGADFGQACYMDGSDREGHPVCYNLLAVFKDEEVYRKAFASEEGRKKFLRWRVQLMEKGIERLDLRPGGVLNLLQVTDLKSSVWPSKKEIRDTMKQAVQILQDNYPEFVARNIFINVPFWYYAFNALLSPFLTQRTKSKIVVARAAQVTETLLKYIPADAIPIRYGGFKREKDTEFSVEHGVVSELMVKSSSTETIEIPVPEVGTTLIWDLSVLGWEVIYKEEFVPDDEGSYTIIIQKGKKMEPQEETVRNSFRNSEPGKLVLTIENRTFKKKKVLYRYKAKSS